MPRLKTCSVLLIAMLTTVPLFAGSPAGEIVYIEGTVDVSRNGEYLDWADVDIGLTIEEYDTIETGSDGYVEIELNAPSGGSLVKVQEGTTFYFTSESGMTGGTSTTLQMLRGSLSLKVGRLTSRESYQVQTDQAVMAVRGTEFNVDMTLDRSVLVTVPEGRVSSTVGRSTVMAEPGTVATTNERAELSAIAIDPSDIDLYREFWESIRLDALKVNARMSIQFYANQWDTHRPRLVEAMVELRRHQDIFRRWERVMRGQSPLPSTADGIRDKQALSRGMIALRAGLPLAERSFYTLADLEDFYRQGYGQGAFTSGAYTDARQFYDEYFGYDKQAMKRTMAEARWMTRIYRFIETEGTGFAGGPSGPDIFGGPSF